MHEREIVEKGYKCPKRKSGIHNFVLVIPSDEPGDMFCSLCGAWPSVDYQKREIVWHEPLEHMKR